MVECNTLMRIAEDDNDNNVTMCSATALGGASEDVQFQSMMLDGVLDLAVIEMWLCQGDLGGPSCDVNATRDVKGALASSPPAGPGPSGPTSRRALA